MKWPIDNPFNLEKHTILAGYVGSIAHGTYVPTKDGGIDDKDIMGVCVPPKNYYLGMDTFEQCATWVDEYDIVIYEIKKYLRLMCKCNPNVMSLLWLQPNHYVKLTPLGRIIIESRTLFSTKNAYASFCGYAKSQLHRMEHWKFNGYMGKKRKELVDAHGFDSKNAAHLIRLLRMGFEFLTTGELQVLRKDASELIAIKKGEIPLEEIKRMADDYWHKIELAFISSRLPDKPDLKKVNGLCMEIVGTVMEEKDHDKETVE